MELKCLMLIGNLPNRIISSFHFVAKFPYQYIHKCNPWRALHHHPLVSGLLTTGSKHFENYIIACHNIQYCLKRVLSSVKALRLVDAWMVPVMRHINEAMDRTKEQIEKSSTKWKEYMIRFGILSVSVGHCNSIVLFI